MNEREKKSKNKKGNELNKWLKAIKMCLFDFSFPVSIE